MKFYTIIRLFIGVLIFINLTGCTTMNVQQGGSTTLRIVEGGLVESLAFGGSTSLNIQITRENMPEYKCLDPDILTIGRFSPVLGSGFSSRSDIYYESPINTFGEDIFMVGQEQYRVIWIQIDSIPGHRHSTNIYSITIQQVQY